MLFTVWQALVVKNALTDAAADLKVAAKKFGEGRDRQAAARLEAAASSASRAQRNTTGPIWWIASYLPDVGDDVEAVRTVSAVADDLLGGALPGLTEGGSAARPEAFRPVRGRFDIEGIKAAQPILASLADDVSKGNARVATLDTPGLIVPLRTRVLDLQETLELADSAARAAASAAELMPTMLGQDGKRTYLLLFQNNAEIRAQGGMPGALAIIEAEDGSVRMTRQGAPRDIGTFPRPFVDLTGEEVELFTTRAAIYPQDTVFIPDFPRSSSIVSQMWERRQPEELDGVLSVDPVALSYLLRATGPVRLAGGQVVTATDARDYLMREVYLDVRGEKAQNTIFADTARGAFDALTGGSVEPAALLRAVAEATTERRIMVWSERSEEQDLLAGTAIGGDLPVAANERPEVGVYVNDSAADKLSAYFDYRVDVSARTCSADRQTLDVQVTMTSTVPAGVTLPTSVVGPPTNPTRPGDILNSVYLYAPPGGYIVSADLDGQEPPLGDYTYRGRDVGAVTVGLERGETRTLSYEVRTGEGETGDPRLITTPGALGSGMGDVSATAC
ncbi:DUF4012 domain-containing protein [Nocardioides sp. HDW12B]|uniref:DUF4012 domain-containing protein n=1 Tax=Nocardioides sp. HDW12B TaxID=2714939 RepID=UPI00140BC4C7|nr:DUF4012 domain-containing protein [Nocardioides sp. HDW12B]QIK64975.1 DUF4012 domain-containing protein [Nocardioides sp. HDW12B]